jgi:hypothetical protein
VINIDKYIALDIYQFLFADAKIRKNIPEDFVGGDFARL